MSKVTPDSIASSSSKARAKADTVRATTEASAVKETGAGPHTTTDSVNKAEAGQEKAATVEVPAEKGEAKTPTAEIPKNLGEVFIGDVKVYPESSMVPADEDWVELKARPSGTRIYLKAGPRPIPLLGKNRVVLAWPKGATRPKVRLKKRRYESYGFQIPRSWIGLKRTVTLEWDEAY